MLRLALLSSVSLYAAAAQAQDATWAGGGGPDPAEWQQDNNWTTPSTTPTGTAFFDASANTTVHNDVGLVTIGTMSFLTTSSAYTFNLDNTFIINGPGVTNSSTVNGQIFNVDAAGNGTVLVFQNSATANAGVGSVTYNNPSASFIFFQNSSNAGNSNTTFVNNGIIQFSDTSTGGSAQITNNTQVDFFDSTSAASATITNAITGTVTFNNSSTAANSTITNAGSVQFSGTATAGSATITNNLGSTLDFYTSSTAGASHITNDAGGTVTFHDNTSGGSGAVLVNNGSWNFSDSSSLGSSSLTNNSTLNFNDSSNAGPSSATIVNNGTLSFNTSASANAAHITNNASIIFNDSTSAGTATITTNSGSIAFFNSSTAGNASITTGSASVLSFADSSTAGSATITTNSGGFVQFFNTSSGGSARFITNTGGTFDISGLTAAGTTAGSIEGAGSYILGSKSLTTGSNNLSTPVSGVISGIGGSLTKVGTGTLTLSNVNSYTGATNVNGGVLEVDGSIATSSLTTVNSGGLLTGVGAVGTTSVASGGVFVPGSGTPGSSMTVTGNLTFASGSLYAIILNPTTSSFATVSGNASGPGTVDATFVNGSYIAKQYTILTAGSVQNGMFAGLTNHNLPLGFSDTLSYDATHAYLNLVMTGLVPPSSLNTNQRNVFNALNNSFMTVGGIPAVFGGLSPSQLTQLSGELGAAFPQAAFQAGNSFLNLMLSPFVDGRFGAGGFGPIGYAAEAKTAHPAEAAFASAMPTKAARVTAFDDRYSLWAASYGGSGRVEADDPTGSHNTNAQVFGVVAGLDYKLTPNTLIGFALGGGGTHYSLDQGLGSGRSDMFQAGVYGMSRWGAAYLSAAGAYSFHNVSTNRTVNIAGTSTLDAGFHANVLGGRAEGGYRFGMPWFGVTPYGALQVQSVSLPSYSETTTSGSPLFALSYASQTVTTTRGELGARFDKSFLLAGGNLLTLYSRAAWAHDWGNTRSASALFQSLPASNFIVNGAEGSSDGALLTGGAEYKMGGGWSVMAKFEGEFSGTTSIYSGAGQIKKTW